MVMKIVNSVIFYLTCIILLMPIINIFLLITFFFIIVVTKSYGILNLAIIMDHCCMSFAMLLAPLLMAISQLLNIKIPKYIIIIFVIAQIFNLILFIPINGVSVRDIIYD